ncbi:MAG TPA: hypothetical protein VKM56_08160, partial [Verrucomicrobiae bacterium]|nr:hypothetical protein [Verrucomicrobiae bacterium]
LFSPTLPASNWMPTLLPNCSRPQNLRAADSIRFARPGLYLWLWIAFHVRTNLAVIADAHQEPVSSLPDRQYPQA